MGSPAYLYLALSFLFVLMLLVLRKPRLILLACKAGCVGGVAGIISEYWYFKDYWRPESYFGPGLVFIEDFLFGFAVLAISVIWYEAIQKTETTSTYPAHKNAPFVMLIASLLALVIGSALLWNSVLVSIGIFVAAAFYMLSLRPDLLPQSIGTALLLSLLMLPIYYGGVLLFPGYVDSVWLLKGTALDVRIFGDIPLTELLWYFSAGLALGIIRPFRNGYGYQSVVRMQV